MAALGVAAMALLVGLSPVTAAESTAKTTLRWKFKPGEVFHYVMDQNTVTTGQDPMGREIKQTVELILDMTWTIKAVDASGVASITETIDRVRTTMAAPFGKFSFDSRDAGNAAGPAAPMVNLLVGAEFTVKMNPRGEVSDIKLSDKLLATLKDQNAQAQFSEVGLKNVVEQMVLPLGEAAVDVGETWKRALDLPIGADGQTRRAEQTFTYKGADATTSNLDAIEFSTKADPIKPDPNVPITLKKETQTGRIEFDNAAGQVVKTTVEEDVEFSVAIQGKEVPQKARTTRTLSLGKEKSS
jgi:hypothetical protein